MVLALLAGWQASAAYQTYVREKVLDQRIRVFDEAIVSAGKMLTAEDEASFGRAIDDFGVIKHGKVKGEMDCDPAYRAMVALYNDSVDVWNQDKFGDDSAHDRLEKDYEHMAETFREILHPKQ
jgi:hypothetical protein